MSKGKQLSKRANKIDFARKASRTRKMNTRISMMRGGPRL